jgi:hypothetical protein
MITLPCSVVTRQWCSNPFYCIKVTDTKDGCRVLDASAHLLSRALVSQLTLESRCIKYSVTSSVKQTPLAFVPVDRNSDLKFLTYWGASCFILYFMILSVLLQSLMMQWRYSPDRALASLSGFMIVSISTMWGYQLHDRPVQDTLIQPSESSSSNHL